jgi:hypothetical protein
MMNSRKKIEREYLFGLVMLTLAIGFFGLAIYLLPYLLFNLNYPVPTFIEDIRNWLTAHHGVSAYIQVFILLLPILLFGAIFLLVARHVVSDIEKPLDEESHTTHYEPQHWVHVHAPPPPGTIYKPLPHTPLTLSRKNKHPFILYLIFIALTLLLLSLLEWFLFYRFL